MCIVAKHLVLTSEMGVTYRQAEFPLCAHEVLQHLADQITNMEHQQSDSHIVLGNVNKANLSKELPKYRHIKCPTRKKSTLDHCYIMLQNAYRSVSQATLGLLKHCLVYLLTGRN